MQELPTIDRTQICELKARYCRYLDTKDWARLRRVFADEVVFDGLWSTADTPDEFVEHVAKNFAVIRSVHHALLPEFASVSPDRVRGVWAMTDYLSWPVGERSYLGVSLPGQWGVKGYGHYEEEYLRIAGEWKISHWRLTRLRLDPLVGPLDQLDYPSLTSAPGWLEEVT